MNITHHFFKVLTLALTLSLVACIEGGDGGLAGITGDNMLTGTAAAGAPIIGQVTVKDALGIERSVTIEANGNYSIDVSGLTAPYRLRAEGTVGNRTYRLYSYAEEADIGGTVNITPFTDLIIANAASQLAENYFNSTNPATLDPVVIDEQEAALKIKLQGVFNALGVDAAVSLLYDSFSTDHTGLDAVLDAVRIEPSTVENIYTIQNYIAGTSITDNVMELADTGTLTCATESGWDAAADGGLGAPIVPYSFDDYETVVKDCGAIDVSMVNIAGSAFTSGTETITLNDTGKAATVNDPETGTLVDTSDGSNITFHWYVEQASCTACTHSYLVLYTDSSIDSDLPSLFWYQQTVALTGISGANGEYYSFVSYDEQSNYSDIDRSSGIDGQIWHETQVLN